MNETSKSMKRRVDEENGGGFPWGNVIDGKGLDIGCGPDKLKSDDCIGFDQKDGDANHISRYFEADSFDYIHASHVLEHMHDPMAAIRDWLKIVKRGGFIVVTVPDVGAYERFRFPSVYNPDHKASFSMIYLGSAFPIHVHIPTFLEALKDVAVVKLARYVERNYDWKRPDVDQTWVEADGVEIWNEFVIQKI